MHDILWFVDGVSRESHRARLLDEGDLGVILGILGILNPVDQFVMNYMQCFELAHASTEHASKDTSSIRWSILCDDGLDESKHHLGKQSMEAGWEVGIVNDSRIDLSGVCSLRK